MHETRIDDPADPRLDDYRGLTDTVLRTRGDVDRGLYIAESFKVIERAVRAGHRPRSVLTQKRWLDGLRTLFGDADVEAYVCPDAVVEAVAGFPVHRGALAAMHRPVLPALVDVVHGARTIPVREDLIAHQNLTRSTPPRWERRSRIAVLEGVTDHTNVGALFRSAAALGVDAVLVTPDCADPLYRRAVRVSMGTVFQMPWTRIPEWPSSIHLLKEAGYVVAGMTLGEGAITLDELVAEDHEHLALVFGSEGFGITAATDALLDRRVTIPMMGGVDSLNVAAASAVTFYATR